MSIAIWLTTNFIKPKPHIARLIASDSIMADLMTVLRFAKSRLAATESNNRLTNPQSKTIPKNTLTSGICKIFSLLAVIFPLVVCKNPNRNRLSVNEPTSLTGLMKAARYLSNASTTSTADMLWHQSILARRGVVSIYDLASQCQMTCQQKPNPNLLKNLRGKLS